jgi:hypothetical protein
MRKLIALSLVLLTAGLSTAQALDQPAGPVILTVKGPLEHPNVGDTAQFDLEMLERLAGRTGEMTTPWSEAAVAYSGPYLRSVLEAAGAHGATLKVTALNDYSASIPFADAAELDTILATRANGKLLSVREKGPLFLIYPFDLDKRLFNEKYFSRSVWQIGTIEVVR